jgi:hypothetical protein
MMASDPRELQRLRWARWNDHLSLGDRLVESSGRSPSVIDSNVSCRMLVSPSDIDTDLIRFDKDFWNWWEAERRDPVTGAVADWGRVGTPTAEAAIRTPTMPQRDPDRYLALYRNGALEIGLLRDGTYESREGIKIFRMNMILGRYWGGLELYRDVIERYELPGPFQIRVALLGTKDAQLGGFAEGWAEPFDFMSPDFAGCPEEHLLYTSYLDAWPSSDELSGFVISLGGWLDDAWCIKERRCIARVGDHAGELHLKGYYWG